MRGRCLTFAALFIVVPAAPAWAHPAGASGDGVISGLAHPILGLDHLLAIAAVGLLAARLGGSALWRLPCAYACGMLAGMTAGLAAMTLPLGEVAIGVSVMLLGTFLMAGGDLRLGAVCGCVALFGGVHGHAHGTEIPLAAPAVAYALGLTTSTAALLGLGAGAGQLCRRWNAGLRPFQLAGATMTVAGLALLLV